MAFEVSISPRGHEEVTIDHDAPHRRALRAKFAAERDRQFFLKVIRSNEAVTARLESSVAKIAESKALLARVNNILRR